MDVEFLDEPNSADTDLKKAGLFKQEKSVGAVLSGLRLIRTRFAMKLAIGVVMSLLVILSILMIAASERNRGQEAAVEGAGEIN